VNLAQASGLAVLAALSPTALLVAAVFLGAADPRQTVLIYLAGAVLMTVVMATIVYVILRAGDVNKPSQHQTRYGLRLGLGLLLLAGLLYVLRRKPRTADPAKKKNPGLISRMIARPGPKEAFIVGVLVYSPSVTFIAAVQVVATSKDSTAASVGALALIIAITLAFVWLPLLLFVLRPDRTSSLLGGFNGWLRAHGRVLLVGSMAIGGVLLTLNGILGLTGVL
jgi:hypothetical protein